MSRHVDPRGLRGIRRVRADAGSVADVKKLLAELQGDWEKFKEAMDEREANIEAKFDDVITREKVDRINTSITELQGAVDDANKQLAALQVGGATESVDPDMAAYAQAFDRFFRKGVEANLAELGVKAKLTTGSDPDGGFVVPSEMESTIDRVLENMSAMRSLARVLPVFVLDLQEARDDVGRGRGLGGREGRAARDRHAEACRSGVPDVRALRQSGGDPDPARRCLGQYRRLAGR